MFRIVCIFALWIGWFGHQPIRGKSIAPSIFLMVDGFKRIDYMTKKKPLAQLINELKQIHEDKYCYDLVNESNYMNSKSVIPVICKQHNSVFHISVTNHLHQKQGCPLCAKNKRRISNTGNVRKRPNFVYGVGVNDYKGNIKYNHTHLLSYHTWEQMLKRCYSADYHKNRHTYKDCFVCEEWKRFSVFKEWFDKNYIDDYCLDKDILVKGNKVYSPQTCCFVPNEINVLLCKSDAKRGLFPLGVSYTKRTNGVKYIAYLNRYGKREHLGTFCTPEEAFTAYKTAKEAHVKEMATRYYKEGKITEKVYNALMNYKVEITD